MQDALEDVIGLINSRQLQANDLVRAGALPTLTRIVAAGATSGAPTQTTTLALEALSW